VRRYLKSFFLRRIFRAVAWSTIFWTAIGIPSNLWAAQFIVVQKISNGPVRNPSAVVTHKERKLVVEPHDTLSQALDRQFHERTWRLWGDHGMIAKIAAVNPQVPDINLIYPGQILNLGPLGDGWVVVESEKNTEKKSRAPANDESAPTPASSITPPPTPTLSPVPTPSPSFTPETSPVMSAPAANAKPENERFGWISLSPSFSYARIDSTDRSTGAAATFLSEQNPGMDFSWGQRWSSHFDTNLDLGLQEDTYVVQETGMALDNPTHVLTHFGLGAALRPASGGDFAFTFGAGVAQELYTHATSFTTVDLDGITVPKLSAGFDYRLGTFWPFTASVHAECSEYLPATGPGYTVQAGSGYDGGLSATEALSDSIILSGDAWYSYATQNSTIATEMRKEIGVTLGFTFRFAPPPKPFEKSEVKSP
jgi:hypothetical protein